MFKLTDSPRNVGNSAIPPDKEDLISRFVQKNATSISRPLSVQDKKIKKITCPCFPFQLKPKGLPSLQSGKKKNTLEDKQQTTTVAFRLDSPRLGK